MIYSRIKLYHFIKNSSLLLLSEKRAICILRTSASAGSLRSINITTNSLSLNLLAIKSTSKYFKLSYVDFFEGGVDVHRPIFKC